MIFSCIQKIKDVDTFQGKGNQNVNLGKPTFEEIIRGLGGGESNKPVKGK